MLEDDSVSRSLLLGSRELLSQPQLLFGSLKFDKLRNSVKDSKFELQNELVR